MLVRLHASGVNPSDVKARAGARPMAFDRVIPHSDGAGIVEAVDSTVAGVGIGDRVFIRNGQWRRAMGSAAEFIALDAGLAHPLPDAVSFRGWSEPWYSCPDRGARGALWMDRLMVPAY